MGEGYGCGEREYSYREPGSVSSSLSNDTRRPRELQIANPSRGIESGLESGPPAIYNRIDPQTMIKRKERHDGDNNVVRVTKGGETMREGEV